MVAGILVHGVQVVGFLDKNAALEIRKLEGKRAIPTGRLEFLPPDAEGRIAALKENDVEMLVCGIVYEESLQQLAQAGISVVPFQAGDARAVLRTVLEVGETAKPGALLGGSSLANSGGGLRPCGPCAVRQRGMRGRSKP
jgi:hypothetical protein